MKIFQKHCLWKEIHSQQRIRHFKILQSMYFAFDVGITSSYLNRIGKIYCRQTYCIIADKLIAIRQAYCSYSQLYIVPKIIT